MKSTFVRLGMLALFVTVLAGCSGSDGKPGAAGSSSALGFTVGDNSVSPTAESIAHWKLLTPKITVTSVSVGSPTVVNFTVKDADGNAVLGLGNKSKSSTATVAGLTNVYFTLAKLVPGVGSAPSKWVSYNVVRPPTSAEKTAAPTVSWYGTYPAVDREGALVDNGDGTYQYTFYRDPTQAATLVAALTDDAAAFKFKADLGDVSLEASLTHRLGIQIGGAAPGTGTNNPSGSSTGAFPSVNMENPGNVVYDFRPDGGAVSSTRNIVKIDSCADCHSNKVLAHGSRKDPNYCVTCHTDQIRYSFNNEATPVGALVLTGTTNTTTSVVDGRALGNFPNLIHKMHLGEELIKTGYNFIPGSSGSGVKFNEVKFPQDQRNCTKCHDGAATDANKMTANGDNWKMVPSRLACGACHDGIDFSTGLGVTMADRNADVLAGNPVGTTKSGHGTIGVGGTQADDSMCSSCHTAATIPTYHVPVTPADPNNSLTATGANSNTNAASIASNTSNLPTGAIKVSYDIKSVSRNSSMQPVMVFRMLQDGVAVPLVDRVANPAATEIWDNFMGAPSVYFVFALPQDGITKPADFNASASSYLRSLWNGSATGTSAGTLTYDSGTGYYTVTLTGVVIPDSAVMLTGGLGYSYNVRTTLPLTQTNLAAYPVTASPLAVPPLTTGMPNKYGGLIVVTPDAQKVASTGAAAGGTGGAYSARRVIVEDARCNNCHRELGVFSTSSFHAGQRNDATTCSWCHTPNRTSSGWGADSTNFIHGIHAGYDSTGKGVTSGGKNKRVSKFNWHATSSTEGFWDIGYPGVLKKCETCHLPGTADFSSSASAAALPNKTYRTVATGTFTFPLTGSAANSTSPYVPTVTATYGSGFSVAAATGVATQAAGTTLVDSPITTVCFACHDTTLAMTHMESNGGSIYRARNGTNPGTGLVENALGKAEQCMLCHGTGRVADIKAMHEK